MPDQAATGHTGSKNYFYFYRRKRRRLALKRPAPRAPENSTEFIIDDFELRNPNRVLIASPSQQPNDEEFEQADFEAAFSDARFEELMRLERKELVERYQNLENSVSLLQQQLHGQQSSATDTGADSLKSQLLALRAENHHLKRYNAALKNNLRARASDDSSNNEDNGEQGEAVVSTTSQPSATNSNKNSPRAVASSPLSDSRSPIHVVHSPLLCIG